MLGLILTSVFLGALGQILVKVGAPSLKLNFAGVNIFYSILNILKNFPVMIGIISYGISFLVWIKVLSKVELSYAYPMVSLGYVLVMLFSYFVFKEHITLPRILGTFLIILGVFFIARS